jgi:cell division septum initiation protein DivIVA
MSRLDRIERDIERAQEKARESLAKVKELEGQLTEAENTEIVAAVRALKMTRAELRSFVATGKLPASLADKAAIPAARFEKKPEAPKTDGKPGGATDSKPNTVIHAADGKQNPAIPAATYVVTNKESEGKSNEA